MEKDFIIIGCMLFFTMEFIKIMIVYYFPEHMKVKIEENAGQAQKPRKVKMPAYWEMSASDLKKIARMQGVPREVILKADLIAELVELSR